MTSEVIDRMTNGVYRHLRTRRLGDPAAATKEVTTMDAIVQTISAHQFGAGVMAMGMMLTWLGLFGGRGGRRGLVRRGVPMVDRLEGWRTLLLGLTIAGLGAAWFWDQRWLLVLSLGFGFTELHESTHILRAWRWDGGRRTARTPGTPT